MPCGYVAFGDRNETRETGFGSEQIVIAGIETPLGDLISNRQQLALAIEEKIEFHRKEHPPGKFAQSGETGCQ